MFCFTLVTFCTFVTSGWKPLCNHTVSTVTVSKDNIFYNIYTYAFQFETGIEHRCGTFKLILSDPFRESHSFNQ